MMSDNKIILFSFIIVFCIYVVLLSSSRSVSKKIKNENEFVITQPGDFSNTKYYSINEVEYINNGCIKFAQRIFGKTDTVVLCGSFKVEKINNQ